MKAKKMSALVLSMLMTVSSLLSGCGTESGETANVSEEVNSGEAGPEAEEGSTKEYSMYIGDAWMSTLFDSSNKDMVLTELEKRTNTQISMELVKSSDVSSEINVMLASGDLPDIIFASGETRSQMIRDGYVIPLNDLIEEHAPNMKKNLSSVFPEWEERDGTIYGLGSFVWNDPRYALNLTVNTVQIRYDILKELGYEKLSRENPMDSFITVEEYLNLLDQVKEKYPDMYPALFDTEKAIEVLFKAKGLQCVLLPDSTYSVYEDGKAVSIFSSKYMPEVIQFLNDFCTDGYAPDGVTSYTEEENQAMIAQGEVFSTLGSVKGLDAANAALSAENEESRFVYFYLVESQDIQNVLINGYATAEGPNLMISKNCEDPEGVIEFLDYCASEEGSTLVCAGIAGETYTVEEDGTKVPTEEIANGYAMWDLNMIKKYGIGNWLNTLPAMEGLDASGNAYDINAQAAFTSDPWVIYNNKDWEHFAFPRTINANAKIDSISQSEAHEALSKISTYAFDRIAKAVAASDSGKCMEEWETCISQMRDDGLEALDQAMADNWAALAEAYGKNQEKIFTTPAEGQ